MDKRLNRQRWLDAGLEQVAAQGPGGVRIMQIAQQLGVTKGSFYWHFRDLAGFQEALLQEWESSRTQQLIARVEGTAADPIAKLRTLMAATIGSDMRLAQAVRVWATTDPVAAAAVARVDHERLTYLAGLLREVGWAKADATTLSHWAYCGLLGHLSMRAPRLTTRQLELVLSQFLPKGGLIRSADETFGKQRLRPEKRAERPGGTSPRLR